MSDKLQALETAYTDAVTAWRDALTRLDPVEVITDLREKYTVAHRNWVNEIKRCEKKELK